MDVSLYNQLSQARITPPPIQPFRGTISPKEIEECDPRALLQAVVAVCGAETAKKCWGSYREIKDWTREVLRERR